jgi:O-antigen/teichoic acid export membrane protein
VFLFFSEIRSLDILLYCYLIGILSSLIFYVVICWNEILSVFRIQINKSEFQNMLGFGIPTAIAAFFYALLSASDRLSLGFSANHYELGIYTVAVSAAGSLNILTAVFGILWAPYIYRIADREGAAPEKLRPYLETVTMLTFFVGAAISVFAWVLPFVFPVDYDLVPRLIPACMSLPLLYILSEAYGIGIAVSRKTKFAVVASTLGALVALLIGSVLVPINPLSGAASATLAGSLAFLILRAEFSAKLWQRLPLQKLYFSTFLYVCGCVLSLWFIRKDTLFMIAYWTGFACLISIMFRHRLVATFQTSLATIRRAMN